MISNNILTHWVSLRLVSKKFLKKLHFPTSFHSVTSCFALIHDDIWGP